MCRHIREDLKVNITLSVDDAVVGDARDYAEAHGTSLNQMIREHLASFSKQSSRERKVKDALAFLRAMKPVLPAGTRITRDEMEAR
jgi:hypothetical protein